RSASSWATAPTGRCSRFSPTRGTSRRNRAGRWPWKGSATAGSASPDRPQVGGGEPLGRHQPPSLPDPLPHRPPARRARADPDVAPPELAVIPDRVLLAARPRASPPPHVVGCDHR